MLKSAVVCLLVAFASQGCNKTNSLTEGGVPSPAPEAAGISSSLDVVKIKAESVAIAAGGKAEATVTLMISPGYHINANPATFPYLISTELVVGNSEGRITSSKPTYPAGQKRQFQFAEQPLAVYEDEVKLRLPLRATPKATKGPVSLPISVRVQACDDEKCYPPGILSAMILVEVK